MTTPWKPGGATPGASPTGTSVADPYGFGSSGSPTASNIVNTPAIDQSPANMPASWGLSALGINASIYAGSTTTHGPPTQLRQNQLLGKIADRLGITPKKGQSLQEQILDSLAQRYGVSTKVPASMGMKGGRASSSRGGRQSDSVILSQLSDKMGLASSAKGAAVLGMNPNVDVSALPPGVVGNPWMGIAEKLGIETAPVVDSTTVQTTTPQTVIGQLLGLKKPQIAALQSLLWQGGFYDTNVENVDQSSGPDAKKITPGNLDPYTMRAFGTMLSHAATYNAQGHQVTWVDYLNQSASAAPGAVQGVLNDPTGGPLATALDNTVNGPGSSAKKITVATSDQMLTVLQNYFEQKLGRLPTQAELKQFTDQYDQLQLQHADAAGITDNTQLPTDFAETGVELVPGVPRPTYAANAFAQSNSNEYLGHQIGNAADMLLGVMRQNGSPTNANQTQAP